VSLAEPPGGSRRGLLGAGALVVAFSLAPRAFGQEAGGAP